MTKYFQVSMPNNSKHRGNSKVMSLSEKRNKARELYKEFGSIKRVAKKMRESKRDVRNWVKDLIDKNPHNSRNNFQNNIQRASKVKTSAPPVRTFSKGTPRKTPSVPFAPKRGYSGTIHSKTRKDQRIKNPAKVITSHKGTFEVDKSESWGWYLVPVTDPRHRELTLQEINGVKLIPDFPRIPADLWICWVDLCFHYCPNKNSPEPELEVTTLLCRNKQDPSKWRMLIPNQTVSGVHVQAEVKDCIDLMTGERFDYFPPIGWDHAGSSHSHNTMDAFFSSTDNKSELSVPGIHIVVGKINKKTGQYTYKASIVLRQLRKHIDFHDIVDAKADHVPDEITFHPDVLKYVYKKSFFMSAGPTLTPTAASYVRQTYQPPVSDPYDDIDAYTCFSAPVPAPPRDSSLTRATQSELLAADKLRKALSKKDRDLKLADMQRRAAKRREQLVGNRTPPSKIIIVDPSKDYIDDELYLDEPTRHPHLGCDP